MLLMLFANNLAFVDPERTRWYSAVNAEGK